MGAAVEVKGASVRGRLLEVGADSEVAEEVDGLSDENKVLVRCRTRSLERDSLDAVKFPGGRGEGLRPTRVLPIANCWKSRQAESGKKERIGENALSKQVVRWETTV